MSENMNLPKDHKSIEKKRKTVKILTYVFLSIWGIIVLFPFYWMILTSVKGYGEYNSEFIPKFFTLSPTLDNYKNAFFDVSVDTTIMNSNLILKN